MAKEYLDKDGLLYFWQKIKNLFALKTDAIKNISRSGTTFTATRADGTTFTFTQQDNTVAKTTTTPKMNGTAAIGSETKYAAGDHVHPSDTTKVDKIDGKGLSTNDFTDELKTKLDGIAEGAQKNAVTSVAGKTGAVALVKGDVGLGNVDNTADENKSVKSAGTLTTARTIDGVLFNGSAAIAHLGTLGTVSNNVYPITLAGFAAVAGAKFAIKIGTSAIGLNANSTFNVNGTGAKKVYYNNSQSISLKANHVYEFIYDGTQYQLIGDLDTNTTYSGLTQQLIQDGSETTNKLISASVLNAAIKSVMGNIKVAFSSGNVVIDYGSGTYLAISSDQKGAANGICPLNASSKIDATYLPSYVDDVIEAYARSGQTALSSTWLATGSATGTVITPETGKIYVLMADSGDYSANSQFRWSGTAYVKLADGGVSSITNAEIDAIVAA